MLTLRTHEVSHPPRSSRAQVLIELATPRVAVAVFADGSPSDAEWSRYKDVLTQLGDGSHRTIVLSRGGGPTALQREELSELMAKQHDVKVAVLTESVVARGIVTALRWFRRESNAAFEPSELDAAFDYLDLDVGERTAARETAHALIAGLGLEQEFELG